MNTTVQKHQSIIKVIAYCIENDESGIKAILKRNGIDADAVKSKRALTKLFLDALGKSKPLAIDFGKYVEIKKSTNISSGVNGEIAALDLNGLTKPATYNTIQPIQLDIKTTSTATKPEMATTGFFNNLNLNDLLNTGVKALELQRDIQISKDNAQAVEQAVQIKRDEMNLNPQTTKSKTGLYVFLGILAVTIIGASIYFVKKKK